MKDSKKYSGEIKKLFRSLKQKYGEVKEDSFNKPIEAVIYGVISEHINDSDAKKIFKRIEKHFVDINDLRVARVEEVCDVLGGDTAVLKKTAQSLSSVLNGLFNKHDTVHLELLADSGKRQVRKELQEFEGLSKFAANYCFLVAYKGHVIPLTEGMTAYLKDNGLVHPEADENEIEGFLERQVSASNGFSFYQLLRLESETGDKFDKKQVDKKSTDTNKKIKKTTKSKTKKTTKKKTTKKKKSTKKTKRKTR